MVFDSPALTYRLLRVLTALVVDRERLVHVHRRAFASNALTIFNEPTSRVFTIVHSTR